VKTRFTYLGDTVIECTVDGDSMTWNVLPALPAPPAAEVPACAPVAAPDIGAAAAGPPLLAAPLSEPVVAAPPLTKKKRTLMGFIRAGWFYIFTALGGVLDYGIQHYTDLPVPPGVVGTTIGGALYGLKRALYPNTTL